MYRYVRDKNVVRTNHSYRWEIRPVLTRRIIHIKCWFSWQCGWKINCLVVIKCLVIRCDFLCNLSCNAIVRQVAPAIMHRVTHCETKVNCLLVKLNRKLRKIFLSPMNMRIEPEIFWPPVRRSNHWATRTQIVKRRLYDVYWFIHAINALLI